MRDRPRFGQLSTGTAREANRALRAIRGHGETDGLTELHERLIELPRTRRGEKRL
jgi:hypothetical protein